MDSLPRIDPTKTCSQCLKSFPPQDLLEYSGALICASCKPSFFQTLRETGQIEGTLKQGNVPLFFPVSKAKLIVLSLCTFGIYEIYWFYKHWSLIKERERSDIKPFWRSIFAIFFCNQLFRSVKESAESNGIACSWKPITISIFFILLAITWRLPDPFWLITFFSFLPLIPVQTTINEINAKVAPLADKNERFTGKNILVIVIGFLWLVLVIIGTFMPQ
ncbi:DUF4234 domain-containing protein [bacterium]|nr:DUF4234 domain-containing protein [bacterium]